MSTFNPDTFMNTEITDASATSFPTVPESEYIAFVKEIKPRSTDSGKAILDLTWSIDDAAVEAATGMKNPTVRQSIFLDITESGGLDNGKGKNVALGRVREALNQNQAGKPWAPGMLIGGVAKITVKHRMVDDNVYTDVKGVGKV
jgi:hypothetical protein